MFCFRRDPDAVLGAGVAFTSGALDLGQAQDAAARRAAHDRLAAELGVPIAVVTQVHENAVVHATAEPGASGLVDITGQEADALVTTQPGLAVAVRVADCVPICIVAEDASVVAAVHAGRNGLLRGVICRAVEVMRTHTGVGLRAWVGPHVCGACYEVPRAMAEDGWGRLGIDPTDTTWGTPSLDLGAATLAQLAAAGVRAEAVGRCTLHDPGLHSHRGGSTGRQVGVAWIAPGR